jgi:hypothetical protein
MKPPEHNEHVPVMFRYSTGTPPRKLTIKPDEEPRRRTATLGRSTQSDAAARAAHACSFPTGVQVSHV